MTTKTKENGFESLIVDYLINHKSFEHGANSDYSKEFAIDEKRLFVFLDENKLFWKCSECKYSGTLIGF